MLKAIIAFIRGLLGLDAANDAVAAEAEAKGEAEAAAQANAETAQAQQRAAQAAVKAPRTPTEAEDLLDRGEA
jgi:hypothetical protein